MILKGYKRAVNCKDKGKGNHSRWGISTKFWMLEGKWSRLADLANLSQPASERQWGDLTGAKVIHHRPQEGSGDETAAPLRVGVWVGEKGSVEGRTGSSETLAYISGPGLQAHLSGGGTCQTEIYIPKKDVWLEKASNIPDRDQNEKTENKQTKTNKLGGNRHARSGKTLKKISDLQGYTRSSSILETGMGGFKQEKPPLGRTFWKLKIW